MDYISNPLAEDFSIHDLYSIRYFEYMSDFYFPGESHDFWEFACVDKGEVYIQAGEKTHLLQRHDIIFHQPNEFHSVQATGSIAPNLVVVSFACQTPAMDFFRQQLLQIDETCQVLIANILREARALFATPLDDPYLIKMEKKEDGPFGAEHLLKLYIEQLLIHLYRRYHEDSIIEAGPSPQPSKLMKRKNEETTLAKIILYMEQHIDQRLTIERISRDNLISPSRLQKLFKNHLNLSVMDYFTQLKINTAKQMIRNRDHNFSQIAEILGYSSVHYFSRQFKKATDMSPTAYASSIQAIAQLPENRPQ